MIPANVLNPTNRPSNPPKYRVIYRGEKPDQDLVSLTLIIKLEETRQDGSQVGEPDSALSLLLPHTRILVPEAGRSQLFGIPTNVLRPAEYTND